MQIQFQQLSMTETSQVDTSSKIKATQIEDQASLDFVEIFDHSACLKTEEEIAFLMGLIGDKLFSTKLLYRGSRDGWMAKDFHSRCDRKGPTITFFKIKNGDCIGGFTSA